MSTIHEEQSKMLTLHHTFDNQDDSMFEAFQNMSRESCRDIVTFDYLQECVNSLESKDSGIPLSPTSTSSTNPDLHLVNFGDADKSSDFNGIDLNFIKIDNIFLQNEEFSHVGSKIEPKTGLTNLFTSATPTNFDEYTSSNIEISPTNIDNDSSLTLNKAFLHSCPEKMEDLAKNTILLRQNNCTDQNDKSLNTMSNEDHNSHDITSEPKKGILQSEVKNHNQLEEVKICQQCSMSFRYKRHLDRHLEGHQKNNCSHCSAKFARRKHLEVHLFRIHGERITKNMYPCDSCSRSFPKRAVLLRHQTTHAFQNEKAHSMSSQLTISKEEVSQHENTRSEERQFKCNKCSQVFSIEHTYLAHLQNHDNYKCLECNATFASKKRIQEHFKTTHPPKIIDTNLAYNGIYFCIDCKRGYLSKSDYLRHLESVIHLSKVNEEVPLKTIFTCLICSKTLVSQRALDQHVRRVHKDEKKFICDIKGCTFQSSRRTDLDRHKHLHVEDRNVICEHCGKTFTSVSILNDHVLYIHTKDKQFICEECGKAFKRNSLLKRHKLSHQQFRPFSCKQCNAAFKRSHHLTRHLETCHRIPCEKKKKVVKLMKTEDGKLVPVPEESKLVKTKIHQKKNDETVDKLGENSIKYPNVDSNITNVNADSSIQSDLHDSSPVSSVQKDNSDSLSITNPIPQILSLIDINSGEVITLELTNTNLLSSTDVLNHLEINSNELLTISGFQDLGLENGLVDMDSNHFDQSNYTGLSLQNENNTSYLSDANNDKSNNSTIENYLTQPFPSFLSL